MDKNSKKYWTSHADSLVSCLMTSSVQVLYIVLIQDTVGFLLFV